MYSVELATKVKEALLECQYKSEELEEAARQLTVQKLRSQLAIETRMRDLEQQVKTAGQNLLNKLEEHHATWQARIHKQEHLVLKHSMQLSSALAKESYTQELVSKLEEKVTVDLSGLHESQFIPSKFTLLEKSHIGFLVFDPVSASQFILSHSATDKNNKIVSCHISAKEAVESISKYLVELLGIEVKRDEKAVQYEVVQGSNCLELQFATMLSGKYSVSVSLCGEGVNGSPLEVVVDNCTEHIVKEVVGEISIGDGQCVIKDYSTEESHVSYEENRTNEAFDGVIDFSKDTKNEKLNIDLNDMTKQFDEIKVDESYQDFSNENVSNQASLTTSATVSIEVNSPNPNLSTGNLCLARWSEDKVWYRARVNKIVDEHCQVTFIDYGNTAAVNHEDIVTAVQDIPEDQLDMLDMFVLEEVIVASRWTVGTKCIAKWSEDKTWYNAVIIEVSNCGVHVLFSDYGNTEVVSEDMIVECNEDIPTGEIIDDCVNCNVKTSDTNISDSYRDTHIINEGLKLKEDQTAETTNEETVNDNQLIKASFTEANLVNCTDEGDECTGDLVKVEGNLENEEKDVQNIGDEDLIKDISVELTDDEHVSSLKEIEACEENKTVERTDLGNNGLVEWDNKSKTTVAPVVPRPMKSFDIDSLIQSSSASQLSMKVHTSPNNDLSPVQHKYVRTRDKALVIEELKEDDLCFALWTEDSVWYNAKILDIDRLNLVVEVKFIDYGNTDKVDLENIFLNFDDLVRSQPHEQLLVDPHVNTKLRDLSPLVLKSLLETDQIGKNVLTAISISVIPGVEGSVGLAVLENGTLVSAIEGGNMVVMWNRKRELLKVVEADRQFCQPADVTSLSCGGFAVRDKMGIMIFNKDGNFEKELFVDKLDTFIGLTEYCQGRLVTINKCLEWDEGKLTMRGETDLLYIDIDTERIVKRVEMIDIIEDQANTDCKSLTMYLDKLYVVDKGLGCIYTLFHEDGEDQAEMVGSPGRNELQFSGASAVAVDDDKMLVVSDTKNNRLQLVDDEFNFVGFVKMLSRPLSLPSALCLDRKVGHLVVHNAGTKEIVRYKLGRPMVDGEWPM